jgi:ubiquinone/menaquinone biosynthesis C-methylase UbiE
METLNPEIPNQDLRMLTYASNSFDLVLCNEIFEHVQDLDRSFAEITRVLRPGGRLLATCPLAFGQQESIIKAVHDNTTGQVHYLSEAELHGDPIRPESGSLVYRIPGWEVLNQLKKAGLAQATMHLVASWKYGVLGSDLPGILVICGQK